VRNIFLIIEYDGTRYAGWQRQVSRPTVQATLEHVLGETVGHVVALRGAGRTDAAVHALGQAATFLTKTNLPARAILHVANRALPDDIVIRHVAEAPAQFDTRRHAIMRHYRYRLIHSPTPPAVDRHTWAHVAGPLDRATLFAAVALFEGEHNFAAFRSSQCKAKRTVLTMARSRLTIDNERLIFDFACRSFLHHMVRMIVGTALAAARGRLALDDIERLLAQRSDGGPAGRGGASASLRAGPTAPPQGLILMGVEYAEPYEQFNTYNSPSSVGGWSG